jgi:cystathionine gamma-synthase/methionine-gamma-lyase
MRGIKTFPLRFERQCANAARIAEALRAHPCVERVYYPDDAGKLLPTDMHGAMVSFDIKAANREKVFKFMDALKLVVRATSLGDVHSMLLYPVMASHRDVSPKQRERMGIKESLVRLSAGIEASEDIIEDVSQALLAAI